MTTPDLAAIHKARETIAGIAIKTPLVPSPFLSARIGSEVLLKLDMMQPMGAFKLRGAANALMNLPKDINGVTCCSTGNHGRGVAYAAKKLGLRAVICMSELVPQTKVDGIRALGAEVRIVGRSQDDAQREVERLVDQEGLQDVSPFDDPDVIAGQGTIGLELMEDRPDLETLIIPLSGGGLAGGIAIAAKAVNPDIRIIGVTMENGAAMYHSIRAGQPVDVIEVGSLADSLGGGIMANNRYTLDICSHLIDETLLVSETEIYSAMQTLFFEDRLVSEGSAATTIAALLSGRISQPCGKTALILTGRNVDSKMFASIIAGQNLDLGDIRIKGQTYG